MLRRSHLCEQSQVLSIRLRSSFPQLHDHMLCRHRIGSRLALLGRQGRLQSPDAWGNGGGGGLLQAQLAPQRGLGGLHQLQLLV